MQVISPLMPWRQDPLLVSDEGKLRDMVGVLGNNLQGRVVGFSHVGTGSDGVLTLGVPTKPTVWTHTDTKLVMKTGPLEYNT